MTLKDFYLKPKSITLYTDDGANIIPVKLSDAQIINSNKAEIIFSVPLTIAIGKCRIKVVSTVETSLTLMNFF